MCLRRFAQQAIHSHIVAGIFNLHLAAQHKHFQAFDSGGKQIGTAQQQVAALGRAVLFAHQFTHQHKARQHTPLGAAPCSQPRLGVRQLLYIVAELRVQESRSISTTYAYCAPIALRAGQRPEQGHNA